MQGFNRRRDACFPATLDLLRLARIFSGFNRRRDACFPATERVQRVAVTGYVSIADATLASPQRRFGSRRPSTYTGFQSQTRRLLPRNIHKPAERDCVSIVSIADATLASPQPFCCRRRFLRCQRFNRRRDACFPATSSSLKSSASSSSFQSQTRRLLPRNLPRRNVDISSFCFNRRRDACFPATIHPQLSRLYNNMFQSQTRRLLPRNTCYHFRLFVF